jgi:hypothetical protein
VSIGVPTGKPATSRPPDSTSSIAISSATRVGGLYSATELPISTSFTPLVRRASAAAIKLGDGIMP